MTTAACRYQSLVSRHEENCELDATMLLIFGKELVVVEKVESNFTVVIIQNISRYFSSRYAVGPKKFSRSKC